jgi:hypothetical protein
MRASCSPRHVVSATTALTERCSAAVGGGAVGPSHPSHRIGNSAAARAPDIWHDGGAAAQAAA